MTCFWDSIISSLVDEEYQILGTQRNREKLIQTLKNKNTLVNTLWQGKELTNKETFYANMFVDEKNYKMKISFLGKEIIKTPIGKIRCLKFSPDVIVGRMFKNQDDLTIWISDDKNHILVKLETGILVGSVDVNLQSVKNIKFPLSITE